MFLELVLAAAISVAPLVVDVSGMPPQLQIIRADAAKNGWAITCEGHSGEEGVLRISAPAGLPSEKLHAYLDEPNHLGSGDWVNGFGGKPLPKSCDHAPQIYSSPLNPPATVLSYSQPDLLEQVLPIAKSCGFTHAFIRPLKDSDPLHEKLKTHPGFQVLDAGENADAHNGPLVCFMQLTTRLFPPKHLASQQEPAQKP